MTDRAASADSIRGLFGRDSLYVVLWGVQLGMAALLTPVTTRLLGPARFGFVASCVAVMQVLFAIASLSLQTAVQRQYALNGERHARRIIAMAAGISLVTLVIATATGPMWSRALGLGAFAGPVRFAVLWACCTAVSNAALGLLRSRDQLAAFATVSLLQSVVAEALGLLLVIAVRRSPAEYVLGQLLAQIGAVAIAIALTRPIVFSRGEASMLRDALRYSIPLLPASLAVFVLESSDRLVLQHQLGSAAVARYAIAYNIGSAPMLLLGVLNNVWMPRVFALADARTRESVLAQSRDALCALLIPTITGLAAAAPILLHIWAPASYHPETLVTVVAIIAATAIPFAAGMSHTRTLLAAGRTVPVAVATITAAAANLGLNMVLVPRFGIGGSAAATLVSYTLLHAGLALSARRHIRVPRPDFRLTADLAVAVALTFAITRLPTTAPFMALRAIVAVACGAGFVAIMAGLIRRAPQRPTNPIAAWMRSRLHLVAT